MGNVEGEGQENGQAAEAGIKTSPTDETNNMAT